MRVENLHTLLMHLPLRPTCCRCCNAELTASKPYILRGSETATDVAARGADSISSRGYQMMQTALPEGVTDMAPLPGEMLDVITPDGSVITVQFDEDADSPAWVTVTVRGGAHNIIRSNCGRIL